MIYNTPREFMFRAPAPPANEKLRKITPPKIKPVNIKEYKLPTATFKNTRKKYIARAASFFVTLYIGTILAFCIPLRPTYSDTEKRNLQNFPIFTAETLFTGDYFDDVTLWFSDTFPFREGMTKASTFLKSLSGFSTVQIHGDVEGGDEIPDVPADAVVTLPPTTIVTTTTPPTTLPPTTAPTTTLPPVTSPEVIETTTPDSGIAPDMNVQTMGAVLIAGDSAYEYYSFSSTLAPRFIDSVSNIKSASGNKSNVYTLVIPTSIDIQLNDAIRKDVNSSDQKKALQYFNASFKNTTAVTGIYENLRNHRAEYLYFRTDHHWTALGAYYAYEQYIYTKGVSPVPLSNYNTLHFDGFLGSFYSSSGQAAELSKTPDTIIAYEPFNEVDFKITQKDGQTFKWDIIKDVNDYAPSNKYSAFIGADQPYSVIENLDNTEGETCVVIKDSFGNAFIPFLIPHYKTIHIIDPRHFESTLSEFAENKKIDDIILIANISATRNEVFINAMENFVK